MSDRVYEFMGGAGLAMNRATSHLLRVAVKPGAAGAGARAELKRRGVNWVDAMRNSRAGQNVRTILKPGGDKRQPAVLRGDGIKRKRAAMDLRNQAGDHLKRHRGKYIAGGIGTAGGIGVGSQFDEQLSALEYRFYEVLRGDDEFEFMNLPKVNTQSVKDLWAKAQAGSKDALAKLQQMKDQAANSRAGQNVRTIVKGGSTAMTKKQSRRARMAAAEDLGRQAKEMGGQGIQYVRSNGKLIAVGAGGTVLGGAGTYAATRGKKK